MIIDNKVGEMICVLYKIGFFEDVQLDCQGMILVVIVKECLVINKLIVIGNKDIKFDQLFKGLFDIGLIEGGIFDCLSLDCVIQELCCQYNDCGKYNVDIILMVSLLDCNCVDIVIVIKEGKVVKICYVNLVGIEKFESKDILEIWEFKEYNWVLWYCCDDQYFKEKLFGDLEKFNFWYLDCGYVDFSIDFIQVLISFDKCDMFLIVGVIEGVQYKIFEIKVSGDIIFLQEDVECMVIQKFGDMFLCVLLEFSLDIIINLLFNIGYVFVKVNLILIINCVEQIVVINMQVVFGLCVLVCCILFCGNICIFDEVMCCEMCQFENSWYLQVVIDCFKICLQCFGYFELVEVEILVVSGSNDQVDVVYNVKEIILGSFVFGLGYLQFYGMIMLVQLLQNNFFGGGNCVLVEVLCSSYLQCYGFSYINLYFIDDGVLLGYNLFWCELDYFDFNIVQYNSINGVVQVVFGVLLIEIDIVLLMFGIDSNQIIIYLGFMFELIIDYINVIGIKMFYVWCIELGWVCDLCNDYFMLIWGIYQCIGLEIILFGLIVEYFKLNYQISKYWLIMFLLVINICVEIGYGDSYGKDYICDFCYIVLIEVNLNLMQIVDCNLSFLDYVKMVIVLGLLFYENFYVGGINLVCGFEDNILGLCEVIRGYLDGQLLGGLLKIVGLVEVYFLCLFDSLLVCVLVFVDFGNVYIGVDNFKVNELCVLIGVVLLWCVLVGLILISYVFLLKKEDGDKIEWL